PDGLIASYDYTNGLLSGVTYADGSGYIFSYDGAQQLTQVIDRAGVVLETHAYASGGVGLTSEVSQGVERYTLSYGNGTTTVTDALGNQTVYQYKEIWGIQRVTSIIGPCSSCGGGGNQTQKFTYDSHGNLLSRTDGLNHTTAYTYDPVTNDQLTETDPLAKVTT